MSFRRPLLLAAPPGLVAALIAGLLLAMPASAAVGGVLDDDLLELAQATPPAPPTAGPDRRDRMANFDPKALCLDRVARRAGNRTYLKIKLDLKPDQVTAWDAFAKASDAADVKDTARCNTLPSEMKDRPNYVDRLGMEEAYMKARVERIEAVKPSLTALYNTLSPEQKVVLDRPRPMGGMKGHRHGGPR
ncbi:MAG TPA: Spy/CpxP family protein refolding chaperone [Methyloceanibacter sp.]|nr:Spy/CpxP family protein refolding chaperone [Methyloceanibacter sp.]